MDCINAIMRNFELFKLVKWCSLGMVAITSKFIIQAGQAPVEGEVSDVPGVPDS